MKKHSKTIQIDNSNLYTSEDNYFPTSVIDDLTEHSTKPFYKNRPWLLDKTYCGNGATYGFATWAVENNKRILIIEPNIKSTFDKAVESRKRFKDTTVACYCSKAPDEFWAITNAQLVYTTYDSMRFLANSGKFDIVLCDEIHQTREDSLFRISAYNVIDATKLRNLVNADMYIAMTATPASIWSKNDLYNFKVVTKARFPQPKVIGVTKDTPISDLIKPGKNYLIFCWRGTSIAAIAKSLGDITLDKMGMVRGKAAEKSIIRRMGTAVIPMLENDTISCDDSLSLLYDDEDPLLLPIIFTTGAGLTGWDDQRKDVTLIIQHDESLNLRNTFTMQSYTQLIGRIRQGCAKVIHHGCPPVLDAASVYKAKLSYMMPDFCKTLGNFSNAIDLLEGVRHMLIKDGFIDPTQEDILKVLAEDVLRTRDGKANWRLARKYRELMIGSEVDYTRFSLVYDIAEFATDVSKVETDYKAIITAQRSRHDIKPLKTIDDVYDEFNTPQYKEFIAELDMTDEFDLFYSDKNKMTNAYIYAMAFWKLLDDPRYKACLSINKGIESLVKHGQRRKEYEKIIDGKKNSADYETFCNRHIREIWMACHGIIHIKERGVGSRKYSRITEMGSELMKFAALCIKGQEPNLKFASFDINQHAFRTLISLAAFGSNHLERICQRGPIDLYNARGAAVREETKVGINTLIHKYDKVSSKFWVSEMKKLTKLNDIDVMALYDAMGRWGKNGPLWYDFHTKVEYKIIHAVKSFYIEKLDCKVFTLFDEVLVVHDGDRHKNLKIPKVCVTFVKRSGKSVSTNGWFTDIDDAEDATPHVKLINKLRNGIVINITVKV